MITFEQIAAQMEADELSKLRRARILEFMKALAPTAMMSAHPSQPPQKREDLARAAEWTARAAIALEEAFRCETENLIEPKQGEE